MVKTEPLSCGHLRTEPASGCRVCHLYRTRPDYRALWDGEPPPEVSDSPRCKFRGESLTGHERKALGLSSNDWAPCSHADKPNGEHVCPCKGCNSECDGFKKPDDD